MIQIAKFIMEEKAVGHPIMAMAGIQGDVNVTTADAKQCIAVAGMVVPVVVWTQ